ncbi:hypothetical protein DSO57_1033025 [Entomophthora muscae]|uniref:Uncharacterized protein n=1 Tax=Entomophthora muscae TaxID=34485 RepID=A0ACC2TY32_9FUNG|nr:hypothetical protein DSO57_1033025 [Entomophthora muscae]
MAEFRSTVSNISLSVFKSEEAAGAFEAVSSSLHSQGLGYYYYLWLFTNFSTETVSALLQDIKQYLSLTLIISKKICPSHTVLDGLHFLALEDKSWAELVNHALDMFYRPFPILLRVGQLAQHAKLTQAPGYFHRSEVLDVLGFAPAYLLLNCVGASWHQLLPQGADSSLIDALSFGLSNENVFALVRFGSDGSIGVLSADEGLYLMIVAPDHPLPVSWQDQLNDDLRFNAPQILVKSSADHKVSLWAHRPEKLVHLLCDYLNNLPQALPHVFSLIKTIGRANGAYSLEALVAMSREVILRELRVLPKHDPSYQSLLKAGKLLGGSRAPSLSLEIPLRSSKKMVLAAKRHWVQTWKTRRKSSAQPKAAQEVKQEIKVEDLSEQQSGKAAAQVGEHEILVSTSPKEPIVKTEGITLNLPDELQTSSQGDFKIESKQVEISASSFGCEEERASPSQSLSPVYTKSPNVTEEESSLSQLLDESADTLPSSFTQEPIKPSASPKKVCSPPQALAGLPKEILHNSKEASPEVRPESPPTFTTAKEGSAADLTVDISISDFVAELPFATHPIQLPTEPPIEESKESDLVSPIKSQQLVEEAHDDPSNSRMEMPDQPSLTELETETSNGPEVECLPTEPTYPKHTEAPLQCGKGPTKEDTACPDTMSASKDEPLSIEETIEKTHSSTSKEPSPLAETGRLTRSKVSLRTGLKETPEATSEQPAAASSKPPKKERKMTAKAARAIEDANNTEAPATKKRVTRAKAEPKLKATPPKRKNAKKDGKKKGKEPQSPPEEATAPSQSEPVSLGAQTPDDQPPTGSLSLTELTKLKLSTFFGKPTATKKPNTAAPPIRPQPSMVQQRPPFPSMGSTRPPAFTQPSNLPTTNLSLPLGASEPSLPPHPMTTISPPVAGSLPLAQDIKPASPTAEATPPKIPKRRGRAKKVDEPEQETPIPKAPKVASKPGPKPKAARIKKPGPPKLTAEIPDVPLKPIRSPSHPAEPVRAPLIEPSIPRTSLLARSKITLENVSKPRPEHTLASFENYRPFYNNSPGPTQPPHYRPESNPYPNQQRDWSYYAPSSAPPSAPFLASHPYDTGYQTPRASTPSTRDLSTMSHAPILPRSSGPGVYRPPPSRPPMHGWEEPGQTKSLRHSSVLQSRRLSQYSDMPFYESGPHKEPTPPTRFSQRPAYTTAPSSHYPLQPRNLVQQTPPPHFPYDYSSHDYGRSHQYAHSYQPSQVHPINPHDPMPPMDYSQSSMQSSQRDSGPHFPLGNTSMPSRNSTPAAPEASQEQAPVPNKSSLKHLLN